MMELVLQHSPNTSFPVGVLQLDFYTIIMALPETQGYSCEFLDSISEGLCCKKCYLVARKLSITSCCGQTYCHACIANSKPCPGCGKEEFEITQHIKFQEKVEELQVYCSLKERKGCGWLGQLKQLDFHLAACHPDDSKNPIYHQQTICGDKVKQKVELFKDKIIQKDLESKVMQSSQKKAMLTKSASSASSILQQNSDDRQLKQRLSEQQELLKSQELKLKQQEQMIEAQHTMLREMQQLIQILSTISVKRDKLFFMTNFSKQKAKDSLYDWRSPPLYTHEEGYKFHIIVDANGYGAGRGKAIRVMGECVKGEYDEHLKWPAKVKITIELINQEGGQNISYSAHMTCLKTMYYCSNFCRICIGNDHHFVEYSKLKPYLANDALIFRVSNIAEK